MPIKSQRKRVAPEAHIEIRSAQKRNAQTTNKQSAKAPADKESGSQTDENQSCANRIQAIDDLENKMETIMKVAAENDLPLNLHDPRLAEKLPFPGPFTTSEKQLVTSMVNSSVQRLRTEDPDFDAYYIENGLEEYFGERSATEKHHNSEPEELRRVNEEESGVYKGPESLHPADDPAADVERDMVNEAGDDNEPNTPQDHLTEELPTPSPVNDATDQTQQASTRTAPNHAHSAEPTIDAELMEQRAQAAFNGYYKDYGLWHLFRDEHLLPAFTDTNAVAAWKAERRRDLECAHAGGYANTSHIGRRRLFLGMASLLHL